MTKQIMVGGVAVGGGAPVTIQSMCNTKTEDAGATIEQILRLEQAGCEIVRVTVPTPEAAEAVETIKNSIHIPLVADIHFDYRLAIAAAEHGADKIRINPGNIGGEDRVKAVVDCCRAHSAHPHRRERRLVGEGAAGKVRPRDAGGARGERAGPCRAAGEV